MIFQVFNVFKRLELFKDDALFFMLVDRFGSQVLSGAVAMLVREQADLISTRLLLGAVS